jgi:hypothetical protein
VKPKQSGFAKFTSGQAVLIVCLVSESADKAVPCLLLHFVGFNCVLFHLGVLM